MARAPTRKRHRKSASKPASTKGKGYAASQKRQKLDPTSSSEFCKESKVNPSYFSLPAEIRNQITSFALTGGHVYLEAKSYPRKLRSNDRKPLNGPSAPAANFLATCRQAYAEGHVMFYTQNTFHLPIGSLEETKEVLAKIKPEHVAMMRNVTLGLTLLDLTPSIARMVEAEASPSLRAQGRALNEWRGTNAVDARTLEHHKTSHAYMVSLRQVLKTCWVEKLQFARKAFRGLKELRVGLSLVFGVLALRGQNKNGLIGHYSGCLAPCLVPSTNHIYRFTPGDLTYEKVFEMYIVYLLKKIAHETANCVESKVSEMGWQEFKKPATLESIVAARKQEVRRLKRDAQLTAMGLQLMSEEEHDGL